MLDLNYQFYFVVYKSTTCYNISYQFQNKEEK